MKTLRTTMVTLALALPMAGILISGCQSSQTREEQARDKLQDAEEQVVVANQELDQILNDSIQLFKTENGELIVSYEQSIAEIKAKLKDAKEENRVNMEKKLAVLEQKSQEMKMKLEEYKADGEENWKSFKNEFSHDMEELGTAFKDLSKDNVK